MHKGNSAIMFRGVVRDTTVRVFGHESQSSRLAARAASWLSRRVNPAIHATAPGHPLPQNGALGEVIPTSRPTKQNPDLYGVSWLRCNGFRGGTSTERPDRCLYRAGHLGSHSFVEKPAPLVPAEEPGTEELPSRPCLVTEAYRCVGLAGHEGICVWTECATPSVEGRCIARRRFRCELPGGHEGHCRFEERPWFEVKPSVEDGKRWEATPRRCGMAGGRGRCVYAEGHGGAHSMGFYYPAAQ